MSSFREKGRNRRPLTGYGTAAPALDFKLLVDELSPFTRLLLLSLLDMD